MRLSRLVWFFVVFTFLSSFLYSMEVKQIDNVITAWLEPAETEAGSFIDVYLNFRFPEGMHLIYQEDFFYFEIEEQPGMIVGELKIPEGQLKDDGFVHYYHEVTISRRVQLLRNYPSGPAELEIFAIYQLCYDETGACVMPEENEFNLDFEVLPSQSGGSHIWKYLIFALLGGLILNFTPCVLPVLSIRAFSLINESRNDKKKIMLSSFAYTAGIIFSFLVLAAVIIILKYSGELIGWGFQFQNTGFVVFLTSLLFVFSLSLFDVFIINLPGMQSAAKVSGKKGLTGSFLLGIFAVLLGTPCTAPLLGAALGFAFAQPPLLILLMFLLIGIGMSLPFILIAFWPGVVKKLPKPGEWMNVFKEVMAFLLLIWTVKMLEVLYYQVGGAGLINVIFFLLSLGFASWLMGRFIKPESSKLKKMVLYLVIIAIIVFSGFSSLRFSPRKAEDGTTVQAITKEGWLNFDPEVINELIAENKPVFIDFTAKWCTTCYTNERTVLFTNEIQDAFARKNVNLFIADFTSYDRTIAEWIQGYGRAGVPVYVFYLPGEPEPVLLPEMITRGMIMNILDQIEME